MKYLWFFNLLGIALLFSGCIYHNECGYSDSYWDEKSYYYDSQGNYIEVCPDNLLYKEGKQPKMHDETF